MASLLTCICIVSVRQLVNSSLDEKYHVLVDDAKHVDKE